MEWSTFCSHGGPSECNVFEPHPRCRHVVAGPAACDANATTHPSASPPCACARQHAFLLLLSSPSPTPIMHCRRRRAGPFSLFFTFSLSDSQFTTQTQTQSQASSWDSFLFLLPVTVYLDLYAKAPQVFAYSEPATASTTTVLAG